MLDIISMITYIFIFIGLPIILIIIKDNDKTEEEQIKYINEYTEKHKKNK